MNVVEDISVARKKFTDTNLEKISNKQGSVKLLRSDQYTDIIKRMRELSHPVKVDVTAATLV